MLRNGLLLTEFTSEITLNRCRFVSSLKEAVEGEYFALDNEGARWDLESWLILPANQSQSLVYLNSKLKHLIDIH